MTSTNNIIYENELVRIEIEDSKIPWLKIFSKDAQKEFSQCNAATRAHIWQLLDLIERNMLSYYQPDKINIASFANYLPQVHWHIMARFKTDSFFPECMWGKQQRKGQLNLPPMQGFIDQLLESISQMTTP